ncbi:MAG: cupin domain-containing protein, partial [Gammaproteobacteria bacterium]
MDNPQTLERILQKISGEWQSRGFSCEVWRDSPGTCWEGYCHNVDELWMCLQGKMELQVGDDIMHPDIGEEILIPARVVHSVRTCGSSGSVW